MSLPEQHLQMFDDSFGKLLPFGDFFRHQHSFVGKLLHGFGANQAPTDKQAKK